MKTRFRVWVAFVCFPGTSHLWASARDTSEPLASAVSVKDIAEYPLSALITGPLGHTEQYVSLKSLVIPEFVILHFQMIVCLQKLVLVMV